jgi:hypothetical protein
MADSFYSVFSIKHAVEIIGPQLPEIYKHLEAIEGAVKDLQ